ncbi:unnamed protein product [Mytilus coruscus]|uniref:CCHC-type domain-containing protein n=1 Tax=Mytilus coruscus TaxID=42192 RepID=A0A6J8C140_MYTCO|nr:unnamed protein product [Mytilus coruscus]
MKNYLSKNCRIERNFADTTHDLACKVKKTENNLRYKGNQVQFDLNSDILDNISGALDNLHHKRYSKAVSLLEESEKVSSNSEDEKKKRAAEIRAVKKMKFTKGSNRSEKKGPAEAAGGPSSVARGAGGVAVVSQPPFRVGGASGPYPKFIRSKGRDICYKCGLYGYWAKECKNGGNSNFTAPRGSST